MKAERGLWHEHIFFGYAIVDDVGAVRCDGEYETADEAREAALAELREWRRLPACALISRYVKRIIGLARADCDGDVSVLASVDADGNVEDLRDADR